MAQVARFAWNPLDISDFPTRHNYGLGLWQNHIERILAGWVGELAVPIYRGREVTGFAQDDTGVDVELSDGQTLRAEYLVGCDGGRSLIRKAAGIEFPGWDPTTSWLAESQLTQSDLQLRQRFSASASARPNLTDEAPCAHVDRETSGIGMLNSGLRRLRWSSPGGAPLPRDLLSDSTARRGD